MRRTACAVLIFAVVSAVADELVLPDRVYSSVVVTESSRAFYVLDPADGTVSPVPKTAVAEQAQVEFASESERFILHEQWREKHEVLQETAREQKELARLQSQPVQERRAYGQHMADADIERLKREDFCFDRYDRQWRQDPISEEALALLLNGEDESAIQLASMAVESQLVTEFVDMELVQRVRDAWLRQNWHEKEGEARAQALAMVTAVVKREADTSIERDATMAYIHRHIDEWQ